MENLIARPARGYAYVVLAALLWGTSGVAGKSLFRDGIGPLELVQVRVVVATILLGALILLRDRSLFRMRPADLVYFLILGAVMAAVQGTYFYAISKIQVAAAILLQYLAPVLVATFSVLFWRERLSWSTVAALGLALAGCYLVVGGYNLELLRLNRAGLLGGLASAVAFAAYSLLGERAMGRYSPWTVIFYAMAFAGVVLHLVYPPANVLRPPYHASQWGRLLYIGSLGTAVPFGLFLAGINHVRATRASITATLEPITAGILAFFLLGEAMAPLQLLGGAAVLVAITLLQLGRDDTRMAPAQLRAQRTGPLAPRTE